MHVTNVHEMAYLYYRLEIVDYEFKKELTLEEQAYLELITRLVAEYEAANGIREEPQ